jgi:hypothetical protein
MFGGFILRLVWDLYFISRRKNNSKFVNLPFNFITSTGSSAQPMPYLTQQTQD